MEEKESQLLVNFVARPTSDNNRWKVVLVEQGPWLDQESELRRVQARLYDCVDAALDGRFAEKFPDSSGSDILIRLDCYDVPKSLMQKVFDIFAETITEHPDNKSALKKSPYVSTLSFELNFDLDPEEYFKRRATQGGLST